MVVRLPILITESGVPLDKDNLLGLRMTTAEFLALPECRIRYELLDGVVIAPPETWGPLPEDANYHGVRMTAEEFRKLPESPLHYELIDGVAIVSPSPTFWHQKIVFEIQRQLDDFLREHPLGDFAAEIDVTTSSLATYRPDVVYISREKAAEIGDRIDCIPDIVVEVVSPGSRGVDAGSKFRDYEASGITEYWLIDPQLGRMQFFVLEDGKYVEAAAEHEVFASRVLAGFELKLERLRRLF